MGLPGLERARNDAVLSQTELAKITGLSNDFICRLESGQRNASPKTLRKLSKALQVDVIRLKEQPSSIKEPSEANRG